METGILAIQTKTPSSHIRFLIRQVVLKAEGYFCRRGVHDAHFVLGALQVLAAPKFSLQYVGVAADGGRVVEVLNTEGKQLAGD